MPVPRRRCCALAFLLCISGALAACGSTNPGPSAPRESLPVSLTITTPSQSLTPATALPPGFPAAVPVVPGPMAGADRVSATTWAVTVYGAEAFGQAQALLRESGYQLVHSDEEPAAATRVYATAAYRVVLAQAVGRAGVQYTVVKL